MTRPVPETTAPVPGAVASMRHARLRRGAPDLLAVVGVGLVVLRPTVDAFRAQEIAGRSLNDVVGIALICCCLVPLMLGGLRLPRSTPIRLLGTFIVVATITGAVAVGSAAVNNYPTQAVRLAVVWSVAVIFFNVAQLTPRWALRAVATCAVLPALQALRQAATGEGLTRSEYAPTEESLSRVYGTLDHPNTLALMCGFGVLVVAAGRITRAVGLRKTWWLAVLALWTFVIMLTFARGAWLAIIIAVVVMATVGRRPVVPVLCLIGGVTVAFLLGGDDIRVRLSGTSSVSYRTALWRAVAEDFSLDKLPFGAGLGQINAVVESAVGRLGVYEVTQVHNDYLRIFLETGLVGFVLYFGAVTTVALTCWRALRSPRLQDSDERALVLAAFGATVMLALVSVTSNIFQDVVLQAVYWAVAGAALGVARGRPSEVSASP